MKTVMRVAYWQPAIVKSVEQKKLEGLLFQDYSAVAVGQVVAEDEDVVCLALVNTARNVEEVVVIPQKSIIGVEVIA